MINFTCECCGHKQVNAMPIVLPDYITINKSVRLMLCCGCYNNFAAYAAQTQGLKNIMDCDVRINIDVNLPTGDI